MRQYRLEPLRRRLFYTIAGTIAVLGLALTLFFLWVLLSLGLDLIGFIVAALPLLLLGGIAVAIVIAARGTRLELSDAGVTLHLPGAAMTTDWHNVDSIAPAVWGPLSGDALKLRRPAHVRRAWWFTLFTDPTYEEAIPLSPFALPLSGSRLEADLRGRLPALYSAEL